jgi:hypothetical protein
MDGGIGGGKVQWFGPDPKPRRRSSSTWWLGSAAAANWPYGQSRRSTVWHWYLQFDDAHRATAHSGSGAPAHADPALLAVWYSVFCPHVLLEHVLAIVCFRLRRARSLPAWRCSELRPGRVIGRSMPVDLLLAGLSSAVDLCGFMRVGIGPVDRILMRPAVEAQRLALATALPRL